MARKKKVSPGNRLVAYYRYSGGSQQTEQSIEGQRRDCEAYARQHGLTIVHEYIDRHISGRGVESRLAFQQMIADSSKHLFDLLSSPSVLVNFHSKCKILGGVAEFFSKAFLCRFPPENLPRPVVYSVHSLPIQVTGRVHIVV